MSTTASGFLSYHQPAALGDMDYVDFSSQQASFQDPAEHYTYTAPMRDDLQQASYYNPNINTALSCDIKPRLTKEQHDILEAHFQEQNKPNTNTKKGFAESLGVSLEKVNNWFQNRRAKSKQDAKKQEGAINLFQQQQQQQQQDGSVHANWDSSTEVSPAFSSSEYTSMMQQFDNNRSGSGGLPRSVAISRPQQEFADVSYHGLPNSNLADAFHAYGMSQMHQDFYDSPQELNRRTLTQEQFDAIARSGNIAQSHANYDLFQPALANHGLLQNGELKQPSSFELPTNMTGPSLTHDPTDFSNLSEHSFPSMSHSQEGTSMSASVSEWSDSRSSSSTGMLPDIPSEPTKAQWQPGQSVEVDFKALNEQFQQMAQARLSAQEQPLAFPNDEAYTRRESQPATLALNMSHIGIDTPQPLSNGVFKAPAPPSSIAARRQRPRPAALGLASLRSQSYSGAAQPHSPNHVPQSNMVSGQPLRRMRSSMAVGGVSQGRVQKVPGSAQRSPLSWTFTESLNSPKAIRHASQTSSGTLAPPTPMSPQFPRPESVHPVNQWQSSIAGQINCQPSISEHDNEQELQYAPQTSALPPQKFYSPPHTPMYHQQQFVQQRMASNFHLENTPPQSAPASQQCFSMNYTGSGVGTQPQAGFQQQLSLAYAPQQVPQLVNALSLEQQMPLANSAVAPIPPYAAPVSTIPGEVPLQYPYGIPIIGANGQMQMAFPPQLQLLQQTQASQMTSPTQPYFSPSNATGPTPEALNPRRPAPEFEVHEYTPSEALKRDAGPHKAVDTGPKNYTFANQGPEHFDKGKKSGETKPSSTTTDELHRQVSDV